MSDFHSLVDHTRFELVRRLVNRACLPITDVLFVGSDELMCEIAILRIVLIWPLWFFRGCHDLALEVFVLRRQLMVLKRRTCRPRLRQSDRYLLMLLTRGWPDRRNPLNPNPARNPPRRGGLASLP